MPQCLECKEEIDHLVCWEKVWTKANLRASIDRSDLNYGPSEIADSVGELEYECPECDAVLFTNEDDAVEFLDAGST